MGISTLIHSILNREPGLWTINDLIKALSPYGIEEVKIEVQKLLHSGLFNVNEDGRICPSDPTR